MHSDPVVSVVTIFHNAEEFLAEAIDSVRTQSFTHWQLILVDDGSSDGSMEIAQRARDELPGKIIWCAHPGGVNRGMSASRNLGASYASGTFITFLDADDTWPHEKLAEQIAIFRREPDVAMVYGRSKAWFSWNPDDARSDHYWDLGVVPDRVIHPPVLFELLIENRAQTPMSGNAMLRRSVFESLGGFEESFHGLYEDAVLFAKLHLRYPTYVSDRTWLFYRQHPDSCTAQEDVRDYAANRLVFLEWLGEYLDRNTNNIPAAARRSFARELWRCRHPRVDRWFRGWPSRLMSRNA